MPRLDTQTAAVIAVPVVLAIVTAAVASAIDAIALRVALQAIAVAAAVLATWRVASVVQTDAAPAAATAIVESLRGASDRRRPTVDRETGLLANWYFALRVDEEILRAKRYGQVFTIVTIAAAGAVLQRVAAEAIHGTLRGTDLAGVTSDGIALLLTHTSKSGAETVIARLATLLPEADIRSAAFPVDGATSGELLGVEPWQTGAIGTGDVVA